MEFTRNDGKNNIPVWTKVLEFPGQKNYNELKLQ